MMMMTMMMKSAATLQTAAYHHKLLIHFISLKIFIAGKHFKYNLQIPISRVVNYFPTVIFRKKSM
jgi:hypothetical protein